MKSTVSLIIILGAACAARVFAAEPPVVGPTARHTLTPTGEIDSATADGAVARFVAT